MHSDMIDGRKVFAFAIPTMDNQRFWVVHVVQKKDGTRHAIQHPEQRESYPMAELSVWLEEMREEGLSPAVDLNRPGIIQMFPGDASELEGRLAFEHLLIDAGVDLPNRSQ